MLSEEEQVSRGRKAQELLSNELYTEAMTALRRDVVSQMQSVRLDDSEGHTRLVMALQMANAVERFLGGVVDEGAAAFRNIQLRGQRID